MEDKTVSKNEVEKRWDKEAKDLFLGRTIVGVRYIPKNVSDAYMWNSRPVIIILDDGTQIVPVIDPECNDGASLTTNNKKTPIIPTM